MIHADSADRAADTPKADLPPSATAQRKTAPPDAAGDASHSSVAVCHVSMHLATGGLERLLVEFARRVDRKRFRPFFVALDRLGRPAEEIRDAGCCVYSLSGCRTRRQRLVRLCALIREHGARVVHTHNTYAHFYGALAGRWAGADAVVNTQHGAGCGASARARWQFRLANLLTSRIVCVSRDSARLCRRQDPFSRDKIVCIHNGIDLKRFAFRGPSDAACAITVGRLAEEKDHETLLYAWVQVRRRVPDARLLIVGEGPMRAAIEDTIRRLGIADCVRLCGESDDVPRWLARGRVYVCSSRTEGISLTVLEAMAVGLPVVATNVGGNSEIVRDGVTGRLVPAADPDRLAARTVELLADRQMAEQFGRAGRRRVEEKFSLQAMIGRYERLYEACLAGVRRRSVPAGAGSAATTRDSGQYGSESCPGHGVIATAERS